MNQKFNIISIILMALLIILLFYVMINYYLQNDTTSSESPLKMTETDAIVTSGDADAIYSNYVDDKNSGDSSSIISDSGNAEDPTSGEGVIDVIYNDEKENTNPQVPQNQKPEDPKLIITSDENISDTEKKEVLKELDQTLMNLLDVVDKVQTVDESRLDNGNEVQP